MRRSTMLLVLLVSTGAAHARGPDGKLGIIRVPNNGIPVIVTPDQRFEAVLAQPASLRLVGAETAPLRATFTPLPGGRVRALCVADRALPRGVYALVAEAGGATDRNVRSVYVRMSFPDTYVIGHVTDTHIGKKRLYSVTKAVSQVLARAGDAKADFVLVTGDLTDQGEADQFREFLKVLDTCRSPTFVCPGNHDRHGINYEQFFGPDTYTFRFGADGYISYDTKDRNIAAGEGDQDADLQVFRRRIAHTRWAVGFTHRYDEDQGMRSQLILFVDDPLDRLIFGHWHQEAESRVPWGTTPYTATPDAASGYFRLFDVGPGGVTPRPTDHIAKPR
jgi:predicted phosphodiesterase